MREGEKEGVGEREREGREEEEGGRGGEGSQVKDVGRKEGPVIVIRMLKNASTAINTFSYPKQIVT